MDVIVCEYSPTPARNLVITQVLMSVFVGEGHTDREAAPRMTDPAAALARGTVFIAHKAGNDDDLLGMVIVAPRTGAARQIARDHEAEIQWLAVLPTARGHGIATRLMIACEQKATALGYGHLVLSTQPTMTSAHRVYKRLGYGRAPARDWQRATGRSFLVYEKTQLP